MIHHHTSISITSCVGNTTLEKDITNVCLVIHGSCGRTPSVVSSEFVSNSELVTISESQ